MKRLLVAAVAAGTALGTTGADCVEDGMVFPKRAAYLAPGFSAGDTVDRWSYGYDSLKKDLDAWDRHPLVKVDSIGASAQGRGIWSLAITGENDSVGRPGEPAWRKRRVFAHARTHPGEIQAHHIAKAMVAFLLDTTELSREIRRDFIFNIIPMYNPDGVELRRPRQNSNGVDIESNWNHASPQPEVLVLRRHFTFLMGSQVPIEVALNLHSDSLNCTRFFFFHEAGGTSPAFVEMEKEFIGKVRSHFTSIEDWHFVKSWTSATGTQYPEGWWWTNFRERVMALTFEDANCPGAGDFDKTAVALARGSVDWLRPRVASLLRFARGEIRLLPEPGGFRVVGGERAGLASWNLVEVSGRRLGTGEFSGGNTFIPTAPTSRAAVLILSSAGGRPARSLLLPSAAP